MDFQEIYIKPLVTKVRRLVVNSSDEQMNEILILQTKLVLLLF